MSFKYPLTTPENHVAGRYKENSGATVHEEGDSADRPLSRDDRTGRRGRTGSQRTADTDRDGPGDADAFSKYLTKYDREQRLLLDHDTAASRSGTVIVPSGKPPSPHHDDALQCSSPSDTVRFERFQRHKEYLRDAFLYSFGDDAGVGSGPVGHHLPRQEQMPESRDDLRKSSQVAAPRSTRDILRASQAMRRARSSEVRQCTASASELASTHLTRRRSLRPASTSRVQRGSSDIRDERTARARTASAPPAPRRSRSSLKPFALPSIHETPPPPPSTPSGRSSSTQTPVSSDKTETVQNGGRKYRGTAHTSSDTLQPDTESSKKTNSEKSKRVDRGDSRSDTKAGTLQARDSCSDTKPEAGTAPRSVKQEVPTDTETNLAHRNPRYMVNEVHHSYDSSFSEITLPHAINHPENVLKKRLARARRDMRMLSSSFQQTTSGLCSELSFTLHRCCDGEQLGHLRADVRGAAAVLDGIPLRASRSQVLPK